MRRISGPLLDRIDMYIEVPSVEYEAMRRKEKPESSAVIRKRVNAAREVQKQRFSGTEVSCNAYMPPAMIGQFCALDAAGERLMQSAFDRLGLTGRSHVEAIASSRLVGIPFPELPVSFSLYWRADRELLEHERQFVEYMSRYRQVGI